MIQQGISNNPNRFVMRDPCGGNWGRVQNIDLIISPSTHGKQQSKRERGLAGQDG